MDVSSELEGAPGVVSNGVSPATSATCTSTPLPLEKHYALVDGTSEEAESGNEDQICMDFSKSISLGVKKVFQKSSTFPTSAGEVGQADDSSHHADEVVKNAPAYERSLSLPEAAKRMEWHQQLKTAVLNGLLMCMTPPVTSVCHSVSSSHHYQRRSKPCKKDNKEKREKNKQKKKQKTKSKKNHQNSTQNSFVLETPDLGLEDVSTLNGQSSPNNLGKHEAMILEHSIGKEAKCGSSFLRRSVSKMHFPIAEAT